MMNTVSRAARVASKAPAAAAARGMSSAASWTSNAPNLQYSEENESNARGYVRKFPMSIKSAKGTRITDVEGNEYFDMLQCAGTLALGHNHDVSIQAAKDVRTGRSPPPPGTTAWRRSAQFLESGQPMQVLDLNSPLKVEFMQQLKSVLPKNLTRTHFCSPAGTDCLDAAVKMCKIATGRSNVVSFHGGYHGHGQSMLALMGNLGAKSPVQGLMPEVHFLPYPYHFRQPFGISDPEEADKAVMKYIETALTDDESGIPKPACVVVEAIQGEGGVQPMSPWALRELRRITKEADIPLVLDEVQAGFCRSGKFFAFQHSETGDAAPADVHGKGTAEKCEGVAAAAPGCTADQSCGSCSYAGIEPDVVCVSKAVGGGMPMACIAFTEELNKWAPAAHTGTFRGNQIGFATGAAGIKFMKEQRLWEAAASKGEWLRARMEALQAELPFIGDVRGRGLMLGVELVQPGTADHTGVPLPHGELAAATQKRAFHQNKLIIEKGGRHGAVLRFLPPLTVEQDELERGVELFEKSLRDAAAEMAM